MRSLKAAALLLLLSVPGQAALVTRIVPQEADPCMGSEKALYAMQSVLVDLQAHEWAYLETLPAAESPVRPATGITFPDLQAAFDRRLAAWRSLDAVPALPAGTVKDINDVSTRIRFLLETCR